MTTTTAKSKRTDAAYRIEAVAKAVLIFEALEGTAFEPVRIGRIVDRTQLPKDTVFRALRTLRDLGWVIQNGRGEWTIGNRFTRFAAKAARAKEEALNS